MKQLIFLVLLSLAHSIQSCAQKTDTTHSNLYLDIHRLPSGKVKFADVSAAHQKDLAVQGKYNVNFLKYWVDESKGLVYCLSTAEDSSSITKTHKEAHGLLPSEIMTVKNGLAGQEKDGKIYFIDVHELGAGKVTTADVAAAHEKDLKVQEKYGVNFINYWVDEKRGVVVCLSQAKKADDVIETHKKAHGLLPGSIAPVQQGQ